MRSEARVRYVPRRLHSGGEALDVATAFSLTIVSGRVKVRLEQPRRLKLQDDVT